MKGKATVSGGGGGGGGRFVDKRAEADVGTNGPTLTMPKSWELSQFVSIELFRRSPRVVGSLEHDLPEVTRAVPEPHKESRHQHPQKSFDLLSEEFTLLRPLLLSDDVDVRRATSCDLVVSDELLVSRHRPRNCFSRTKRGLDARVDEGDAADARVRFPEELRGLSLSMPLVRRGTAVGWINWIS